MSTGQGPQQEQEKDRASSAQEWGDIFRQIHDQVRREAARVVGTSDDADWDDIGRDLSDSTRRTAEPP